MNIDYEVKVTAKCDGCEKPIDLDNDCSYIYHQDCSDIYPMEIIKDVIESSLKERQWEDYDHYIGFKNEEEKKCFMRGIRKGMSHMLFTFVSHFGDDAIYLWEKFNKLSK